VYNRQPIAMMVGTIVSLPLLTVNTDADLIKQRFIAPDSIFSAHAMSAQGRHPGLVNF
jgi:hypothetical protein